MTKISYPISFRLCSIPTNCFWLVTFIFDESQSECRALEVFLFPYEFWWVQPHQNETTYRYTSSERNHIQILRRVSKLMLARWWSQPIKYRVQERQAIIERLQRIRLKPRLSVNFCMKTQIAYHINVFCVSNAHTNIKEDKPNIYI